MLPCGPNVKQVVAEVSVTSDSVIEASYPVFHLSPRFANTGKRLVKAPKRYFYDTGLVCRLPGIETPSRQSTHPLKGVRHSRTPPTMVFPSERN